jgi:hypothetical protein
MEFKMSQPSGIRYVLVHQDERVDTFSTLQDAFDEGIERYGIPPFRVIEEKDDESNNPLIPFNKPLWTPSKYAPDFRFVIHEPPPERRPHPPPDLQP